MFRSNVSEHGIVFQPAADSGKAARRTSYNRRKKDRRTGGDRRTGEEDRRVRDVKVKHDRRKALWSRRSKVSERRFNNDRRDEQDTVTKPPYGGVIPSEPEMVPEEELMVDRLACAASNGLTLATYYILSSVKQVVELCEERQQAVAFRLEGNAAVVRVASGAEGMMKLEAGLPLEVVCKHSLTVHLDTVTQREIVMVALKQAGGFSAPGKDEAHIIRLVLPADCPQVEAVQHNQFRLGNTMVTFDSIFQVELQHSDGECFRISGPAGRVKLQQYNDKMAASGGGNEQPL